MRADAFVDSGGFFAVLVKGEPMHRRANELLRRADRRRLRFVTTDYVLDETATLLKVRGHGHLCRILFETVFDSAACEIEWMDPERFIETRRYFIKRIDQEWSFTDCFSFWIMQKLGIRDALSSDVHFRQAGFDPLLA